MNITQEVETISWITFAPIWLPHWPAWRFFQSLRQGGPSKTNPQIKTYGINNKTSNWIGAWLSHIPVFQRVVVDGHTSNSCPVLSGIPQGSVLGPCLFLIYINDIPDTLKSNVRLFADDTIVYLTISAWTDCHTLQSDLHKLEKWEEEWLMSFNICFIN
jgi:hypothetical protein